MGFLFHEFGNLLSAANKTETGIGQKDQTLLLLYQPVMIVFQNELVTSMGHW